jgi:hypothetical protein
MKKIILAIAIIGLVIVACDRSQDDKALEKLTLLKYSLEVYPILNAQCNAGDMDCSGKLSRMCNYKETWETYQDCGSIGEKCYSDAAHCGGFVGITCCGK